ncbi:restriction endonuclease subunit S [Clostridium sp.]|uniref:restriction endonuclease subunit S n=1 Tax=Clostridium sp. TaxID=1506 RepID=UPI0025C44F88|nr:restriction endonuclease subunit S [Clostridium sp.]
MKKIREGYKAYEFGEIPSDWKVKKIGDIFSDLRAGSTPSRKIEDYFTGDIPWITSGELKYKVIYDTLEKITEEAVKDTNLELYPEGTFFIAITGLEATGTRGSCAISGVEATTNQSCMAFKPKDGFSNKYLYHWYRLYGDYIGLKYTQGTKQQSLNNKIVAELEIPVPKLEEQEKIASILSTVDEQIDNVDGLINKNKELKKGLMQQLLTKGIGHTKFKKTEIGEIPEEWEVKTLDLIGEIVTGSTPKTSEKDNYGDEYLWVSPGDLGIKKYVTDTVKMLSHKGFSKTRKLPKGAILVTCIGSTIGKMGISRTELSTNQQINSIICNDKANSEFIYYALNYNFKMYTSYISTQAVPIINKTTFGEFLIQIPSIQEQTKIALLLSEVDKRIEEYENKKQKLEELKKGLMQQMLTGKIRVI